jgi:glycosyltransferase involved in cell wall biosynthesis
VDDGSQEVCAKLCDELAQKDPRIKVLHLQNQGQGLARNCGMEVATGEYIGFVDSDDFVEPDMFKTLYEKALQNGSDLVMSGVIFVDGNMFSEKGECVRKTYFEEDTHFDTEEALKMLRMGIVGSLPQDADDSKYGMSIWKNLFRHEIIKKNNLSFQSEREVYSEDALFMIDYISCIDKATGISGAFYNYCRNGDSISKSYKKDRFEKSLVFINEVEKRFNKDIKAEEYRIYTDRFWQAMCRVLCLQEIIYAQDNSIKYSVLKERLKMICTHSRTLETLKKYPIWKLPLKQGVFAFGVKHKLYFLLKLLVEIRR